MRMGFERDTLGVKVEKLSAENERLYRITREVEEDSQKMRNHYYTQHRMTYR